MNYLVEEYTFITYTVSYLAPGTYNRNVGKVFFLGLLDRHELAFFMDWF